MLRSFTAAAALAAAVAVSVVVVRRRCRRLRREAVAERLMAVRMCEDNAALSREVERFRRRMDVVLAQREVLREADQVLESALAGTWIDPNSTEGEAA